MDPTFRFMTVDWDGRIRMDCSSPYAMARLIEQIENMTDFERGMTFSVGTIEGGTWMSLAWINPSIS